MLKTVLRFALKKKKKNLIESPFCLLHVEKSTYVINIFFFHHEKRSLSKDFARFMDGLFFFEWQLMFATIMQWDSIDISATGATVVVFICNLFKYLRIGNYNCPLYYTHWVWDYCCWFTSKYYIQVFMLINPSELQCTCNLCQQL